MSVTPFEAERTVPEADLTDVVDERRLEILAALQHRAEPVDRRALAEQVAAAERGVEPAAVSEQTVDDVLLTLHHVHLPKLEDAGYLEYDVERNLVAPRSASADAETAFTDF